MPDRKKRVIAKGSSSVVIAAMPPVASVLVALIALFGPAKTGLNEQTPQQSNAPGCSAVFRNYVDAIRADPDEYRVLTAPNSSGKDPIDVAPDARACGLDAHALSVLRGH